MSQNTLIHGLVRPAVRALAAHTGLTPNQMSVAGHRYDLVSDCIVGFSTFIGIGIGVGHTAGLNALWLGALAGLGIGVLFLELNVMNLASVRGHDLFGGRIRVDPDDAMIVVPVLVWCDLA